MQLVATISLVPRIVGRSDRAEAAGLRCRPLGETVRDTWDWLVEGSGAVLHERQGEHGITPDKEAQLLTAWESSAAS